MPDHSSVTFGFAAYLLQVSDLLNRFERGAISEQELTVIVDRARMCASLTMNSFPDQRVLSSVHELLDRTASVIRKMAASGHEALH